MHTHPHALRRLGGETLSLIAGRSSFANFANISRRYNFSFNCSRVNLNPI